jgi:hypothetical protein
MVGSLLLSFRNYSGVFSTYFIMTYLDQSAIHLLNNRFLFEEIHRLKSLFIQLFSDLANEIQTEDLLAVHSSSQGMKISKGNELANCPYQVLDIMRDFDKEKGFNIRLMNWWGRGLYIFVYLGKNNERLVETPHFISRIQSNGYLMSKTSSPWDYQEMIDEGKVGPVLPFNELSLYLRDGSFLQLVKKIDYPEDLEAIEATLRREVAHILKYYAG